MNTRRINWEFVAICIMLSFIPGVNDACSLFCTRFLLVVAAVLAVFAGICLIFTGMYGMLKLGERITFKPTRLQSRTAKAALVALTLVYCYINASPL